MFLERDTLLDTGPLVAMLNRRDQWHETVRAAWPANVRRCVTTESVVVEATHMVGRGREEPVRVLELLLAQEIPIVAVHMPVHDMCVSLMRQYRDNAMDYTDAVLVALAVRLEVTRIFTTDLRGFRTWRTSRGAPLEIVPLS